MPDNLGQMFSKVSRGLAEYSLTELFDVLGFDQQVSTLSKVQMVGAKLSELELTLIPDTTIGELNTPRRVIFSDRKAITPEYCAKEIEQGEGGRLEFKSSLLFDHKRAIAQPDAPMQQLKSESVLHSSLKSIAAFLTSGGGVLYIGVDDEMQPIGIEYDFQCMTSEAERRNCDQWQLIFRTFVRDKFKEGQAINDYIECSVVNLQEKPVVRVEVAPRRALSFLREGSGYALYTRQGNQTVQITVDRFEESWQLESLPRIDCVFCNPSAIH